MEIISVESGPIATIGYLVYDIETRGAIIIDTPMESCNYFLEKIKENEVNLIAIILTHSHWDHTADAYILQKNTGADVMIHPADEYRLLDPNAHSIFNLPFKIDAVKPQKYLNHLDIISIGNLSFEIRHTPGHTEGSICIIEHNNKTIFSGDTIFEGSVGRVDLPGGNWNILKKSIKEQILNLSDDYKIYPGHGRPTSVGVEKVSNIFINEIL
jgi:hydroxyacylglutathione hydrolase